MGGRRILGLSGSTAGLLTLFTVLAVVAAILVIPDGAEVAAYESYHDPNQNDVGYCTTCHPGFAGGRSDVTHALHTGGTSSLGTITTNCNLCHTGSGRDNPFTMWATGDADNGLGCAGCHGRDYGETIGADYRGFPIAGLPKASAYGLRNRHNGAGITECVACHGTVPVQAENVAPPYYGRADVLGGAGDPCADNLDNDGDGFRDGEDSDCAAPNQPPVAVDDSYVTDEDVTLSVPAPGVLGNDSDADGDALTAVLDSPAANGVVTLAADGSFTYVPNADYFGPDSFTYVANDGQADSNVATVSLTVNAVNDPPVADPDGPYTGSVGVPVTFDGSASSDIDGTIVSYMWDFGDGNTGTGIAPSHTYGAAGLYTVSLTVTDDGGATDTATTTATISEEESDLDIKSFRASHRANLDNFRRIRLTLVARNNGFVDIPGAGFGATATIVGMQDGVEIYSATIPVWDPLGDGGTRFRIEITDPSLFVPGTVMWTATLSVPRDVDGPGGDVASASTLIVGGASGLSSWDS